MLNIVLNIDLEGRIYSSTFGVCISAHRPREPNLELDIRLLNVVLNIDLEG